MKVFKFGGASVSTPERIRNVCKILWRYKNEKLLVVVSAMGKTTNALEKVTEEFFSGKKMEALYLFEQIKQEHLEIVEQLKGEIYEDCNNPELQKRLSLTDYFTEVEWLLYDKPVREYDYYYDQVVCLGELLSSAIVSWYLNQNGVNNTLIDVRDIFRTDDNFRDANIDWKYTSEKINTEIKPVLNNSTIVLTQGFIGATDENESTTLGREGSDYSAAVFANLLDAES